MSTFGRPTAGNGAGPWCSVCGRTLHRVESSFDPRHPIGECYYTGTDGETHGHGRVPGIRDVLELRDVMAQRARERAAVAHSKHDPTHPTRGCRLCFAQTPNGWARSA